jgi:hypothetical protein
VVTPNGPERPSHPTMKAALLMMGIVVAIVVLAAISTFSG